MNQSSAKPRILLIAAMLTLCLCAGFSTARAASDNALMQESFQQFDQNLDGGWRTLQVKGDYLGSANAMLEYLSVHSATLETWQKDSLAFHLGHVYALAGNKQEAIHWFRKSMTDHEMTNSAYTESFIAFLDNNKPALLTNRHTIATTNPGSWRAGDLREIDSMLEYFGEPFEAA